MLARPFRCMFFSLIDVLKKLLHFANVNSALKQTWGDGTGSRLKKNLSKAM